MKELLSLINRSRRSENGNVAVEFAFIGPVLIVLTLGVIELGRIAYTFQKLQSAVGIATRMVRMGATEAEIEDAVRLRFPLFDGERTVRVPADPIFVGE